VTHAIDLNGRVAVVTGGGGGIGAAVVDSLAGAGARVVVAEIDAARAAETVTRVAGTGGTASASVVDVRDPEAVASLRDEVHAQHGHVDVLVNNVGHYLRPTPFHRSSPEHWQALHDVNLLHAFLVTRAFLPTMIERERGAIVNVSSVEALRGYPPDPVYGAYKAALAHFTRCLALEVGRFGIRVNAIAPDVTQSIQVDYSTLAAGHEDRWPLWVPVGRRGEPADQADVVLFLVSDLARFVTGHVVPTDGGTLAAGGWFRLPSSRWTNRPVL
jgi:NAD(P)-dependent dehydrogenase (short-subunit alcohol dehydrogenase family)